MINAEQLLLEFLKGLQNMTTEELMADIEKAREDSKDSWMFDEENEYFEKTGKLNLYKPRDCLSCAHSFSDEQDRLHCDLNNYKIVDDDFCCKYWN